MAASIYPVSTGTEPNWTLIASGTATSGSTIVFSSIAGYKTLRVVIGPVAVAASGTQSITINGTNNYQRLVYGINSTPAWTGESNAAGGSLVASITSGFVLEYLIYNADKAGPHPFNYFIGVSTSAYIGRGVATATTLAGAAAITTLTFTASGTLGNTPYYLYGAN